LMEAIAQSGQAGPEPRGRSQQPQMGALGGMS
jgi:hypothetical protein